MIKMRSYQIVISMFAKYSRLLTGFDIIKKIAQEYYYANEHTISLMLKDLDILYYDNKEIKYNWNRLAELMEDIENE